MYQSSQTYSTRPVIFRFVDLPDEDETLNDFAGGLGVLGAVRDSGVLESRGVEPEEVLVLSEKNASFGKAVGKLLIVERPR